MVLVLRCKVEFWLVCDKYILDTEINVALVLNWYYLESLARRNVFCKVILGMPNTFWVLLSTFWVCDGHIKSITSPKSA
jgi:uncharacterized membrane protein YccF (DUF307 family)